MPETPLQTRLWRECRSIRRFGAVGDVVDDVQEASTDVQCSRTPTAEVDG
jgi:hypothetical protein